MNDFKFKFDIHFFYCHKVTIDLLFLNGIGILKCLVFWLEGKPVNLEKNFQINVKNQQKTTLQF